MSSSGWVGIPGKSVPRPIPTRIPNWTSKPPIINFRPPFNPEAPVEWFGSGVTFVPWAPKETTTTTDGNMGSEYDSGDTAFVLFATALVWLMIPGLGFFYSGLARAKSALSLIMLCSWSIAIVSVQWFLFGYSLAFSKNATFLIGNFDHLFLQGVYDGPSLVSDKISALVFCLYQGMFAAITPALAIGSAAERNRFLPTTIFIFLWTTFVYDFLACWTWNPSGWSAMLGGLDFAGGTPVHISSGAAGLAYALVLGKREKAFEKEEFRPHNMAHVFLGTALLWFGWFGFNGGSALEASTQAVSACLVTNLSACMAGITWVLLDYRHERKYSPLGFCSGAVAGLVCITPACGYVSPASSLVFGVVGAVCCHIAVSLKNFLCYDDALDVFAVHGVGGIVGNILTGVFAQQAYAEGIDGGGLDGNWIQVLHQLIDTVAGFAWSFVITLLILFVLNIIPGCRLRVDIEAERVGVDTSQLGQNCYDFVEEVKLANANQLQFGQWVGHGSTKFSSKYGPGRKFDYGTQLTQIYPAKTGPPQPTVYPTIKWGL